MGGTGGSSLSLPCISVGVGSPVGVLQTGWLRQPEDAKESVGRGFRTPWATRVAKKSSDNAVPPTSGDSGKIGMGQEDDAMGVAQQ